MSIKLRGVEKTLNRMIAERHRMAGVGNTAIVVGCTANYAARVHEDLHMRHQVGQAKFMETAIKVSRSQVISTVKNAAKLSQPIDAALVKGALLIQRESMIRTPVDIGNLRASHFTRRIND